MIRFSASRADGFSLIEVLVALMVAGLLTAMVASLLGRGFVASSAMEETAQGQQARVTFRRILDMDMRNMHQDSDFQVMEDGFSFTTSHNHLIPGPLPVTATWTFSQNEIVRVEEQPDLEYTQRMLLIRNLERWDMSFFDLSEGIWVDVQSWLRTPDKPSPAGLRLRVLLKNIGQVEIIERLPLERDSMP